jgi:hypothetical protein
VIGRISSEEPLLDCHDRPKVIEGVINLVAQELEKDGVF